MPRSKPIAHRLAPPNSSQSERDSHPHSATALENHLDPYQSGSQRQQQRNHSVSLLLNQPHSNPSLVTPSPKRRESHRDPSARKVLPEGNHGQLRLSPKAQKKRGVGKSSPNSTPATVVDVDPLHISNSRPSMDTTEFFQHGNGSLSPRVRRLSSPPSCATSDTASVALEDCVPELEEFDDIVLPGMDTRRNPIPRKSAKRPPPARDANGRFLNGSAMQSSTSRAKFSDGSIAVKAVVADPTANPISSPIPVPSLEVRNPVSAKKVDKRKKSSFVFVSDDEVKSVFERVHDYTDGSGAGTSSGDVERNRFGDYWKELETISIRNSAHAKAGARNGGQKRLRRGSSKAPSLDPQNRGMSSKTTEKRSSSRTGQHGKSDDARKQGEMKGGGHPITEENIDGGDAIPVDVNWKRKALKRGRSGFESFRGSSTEQRSQWHSSNKSGVGMGARSRDGGEAANGAGVGLRLQNGLDEGEETGGSTGFSESDGQACMQCGGHGKASKMVLCDVCSDGCHTFCMRPARVSVPLGVWICPRCHSVAKKHKVHLSKLGAFMESNGRVGG